MNLTLQNINLKFSHKLVLQKLSLDFEEGQLHALLGQNGAGKSSLANIICGEILPDSGRIFLDDKEVKFTAPRDAIQKGICYVHQRPMLADFISVKENLLLGLNKEQKKRLMPLAQKWLAGVNLKAPVKNYGADTRFFIALCSALIKEPKLLILDEPSALLEEKQIAFLYQNLRDFAKEGMNIIIITHNYDEATRYCQTIDYLEDGRVRELEQLEQFTALRQAQEPQKLDQGPQRLYQGGKLEHGPQKVFSYRGQEFYLAKGEITLIKGLALDGLDEMEEELLSLRQVQGPQKLAQEAIAFIPTDRKFTGSDPRLSIEQMLTSALDIPENLKRAAALQMIRLSGVDIEPDEKCSCLSGGMLQKLMFEREFYNNPELLILCNPLQGLDVQSCQTICKRLRTAAREGAYVLVLSYGAFPSECSDKEYRLVKGKLEAA